MQTVETARRELVRELNEATEEYSLSKTAYEARRRNGPPNDNCETREVDPARTSHEMAQARWDAAVRAVREFEAAYGRDEQAITPIAR